MRGKIDNNFLEQEENHETQQTEETLAPGMMTHFSRFIKTTTFVYQILIFIVVLVGLSSSVAPGKINTTLDFGVFFHSVTFVSIIVDFFLRAFDFNRFLPEILRSSIFLIGIYFIGALCALVLGIVLVLRVDGPWIVCGSFSLITSIMLIGPLYFYIKTHIENGYCIINGFPI